MTAKPVKILHVVGGLDRGGAETWLMNVLRNIDRQRFSLDFLVHADRRYAYSDEVHLLGSKVIACPRHRNPVRYARTFKEILREYGPYDVVHSHVHHYSGVVLQLARSEQVHVRIAHSHSDTSLIQREASLPRRAYHTLCKALIRRNATLGLAGSRRAANALFGPAWSADPRFHVIHYGINLSTFENVTDTGSVRDELGIPRDALVMGHIGRFVAVKNHRFLLDVAAEVAMREPHMRLLLVGDGELREHIHQQAIRLHLADKVMFTGIRSDIARLMTGAIDVLLLPSIYEGLPVVAVEAQAAGLPLIVSDTVTTELKAVSDVVRFLPLSAGAGTWANAVLAAMPTRPLCRQPRAEEMRGGPFDIECCVRALESCYLGGLHEAAPDYSLLHSHHDISVQG